MLQLALRGVRYNTGRYIATLVAIITGVAFFTATGFVSVRAIDALEGDADRQFGAVDVAVVVDPDAEATAEVLTLPEEALDEIAAVDGVEAVAGELTAPVAFGREDGTTFGDDATGRRWVADEELNPLDVVEGEAPAAAGEVAVDRGLADREGLAVGDEITVLTVAGEQPATVVGITAFGSADSIDDGGTVSISDDDAFEWLALGQAAFADAYLRTSGDPAAVAAAVGEVTPAGFVAIDGDTYRADRRAEVGSVGVLLKQSLQAFALLALFVGAFVIYNTFSVIVAQRQRELAVLAAVGATPKQIKRSLRFEGLAIGLLGSMLGVVAGFALTFVLGFVLEAVGVSLPSSGLGLDVGTVVQGILLGTAITFLSVTVPARRAARAEPIEAMRDAAAEDATVSQGRVVVVAGMLGLGLVSLLVVSTPAAIGGGVLLLVVGVLLAGPLIALGGARLARPAMARLGLEGRLAADNSARNPKRTATTANALLIGVFLVTFVTVAGTSLKDYAVAQIQQLEGADFVIESDGGTIDDELVAQLEAVPDVEQVTPFRRESVTIDGAPGQLATGDLAALVAVADIEASSGSLDDLGEGTIAVPDLGDGSIAIGQTVTVADAGGDSVDLEVVALLGFSLDEATLGAVVDTATFDGLVGDTAPTAAFLDVTSGAQTEAQGDIEAITDRRPDITLSPGNVFAEVVGSVFDFLINAVNGLLLMSVVVALIGIVNTLSLSILERRRELGLLRVVGMTDRRVQRMVRWESALIALLGTLSGIVLGLVIGWGLIFAVDRSSDAGIAFAFPGLQLLVVLVLGVVLAVVASFLPARRSTRLEVLDAIQAT